MRAVIQRVTGAAVTINKGEERAIGPGLLVLLGIEDNDTDDDIAWLSGKICRLRIFPDTEGVMNVPVTEMGGEIMVISQFTLFASTRKGNRPSWIRAAGPEKAVPLYESFLEQLSRELGKPVTGGEFGAHMDVQLVNTGPVTILIDTHNKE